MKKSLALFSILIFSFVLIAGCGGGGGSSTVATVSPSISLSGAIPTSTAVVTSPSKSMNISLAPSISSSDLIIEAVDSTGSSFTPPVTTQPTAGGSYTLAGIPSDKVIFIKAKIKSTGKALLKRYVGKFSSPADVTQITGIDLDEDSTAKALVVETLLKNSSDKNLVGALEKPIIPKSGNAFGTTGILSEFDNVVTATVKQALGDAVTSSDTDTTSKIYELKTKVKNFLKNGSSITDEIDLSTIDSTIAATTMVKNAKDFVDNHMSVPTEIEIGGKSFDLNSDGIEVSPDQYHNIRGAVVFDKDIDLSNGYVVLKVSVTNNGIRKEKTVYSKNAPSTYSSATNGMTWEEAFGYTLGNLPYESPNKISMDFKEDDKFSIESGSIVKVEVIFSGIVDKTNKYPIVLPSDFSSTFTFVVK